MMQKILSTGEQSSNPGYQAGQQPDDKVYGGQPKCNGWFGRE